MNITLEYLMKATGATQANAGKYLPSVQRACKDYGIDTPQRVAGFLSQIGHESGGLAMVEENLNYSAEGLANTWPRRFAAKRADGSYEKNAKGRNLPNAKALELHRNPTKIANSVYASRMGNGDEASGEGWRYRGRGLKQLTGKNNYTLCGSALGKDLVADPDLLLEPLDAALSAAWFWSTNGLNALADVGDVEAMTKRINGGVIGLAQRKALYDLSMADDVRSTLA